jgi:hypothetical protein
VIGEVLQRALASDDGLTKNPNMENMARRPFSISLTLSSAKASRSSAKPRGSKLPPGYI